MTATVEVLRSYGKMDAKLSVSYLALNPNYTEPIVNGPQFPVFAIGDILGIPLVGNEASSKQPWKLLQKEDFGMLIPCVADAPPIANNRVETLWSELAQTFARGSRKDVHRVAYFLQRSYGLDAAQPDFIRFLTLLEERIGNDEARWLESVQVKK